jgi:hypothetical protein
MSPFLTKVKDYVKAMNICAEVEVELHSFLASALHNTNWIYKMKLLLCHRYPKKEITITLKTSKYFTTSTHMTISYDKRYLRGHQRTHQGSRFRRSATQMSVI